MLKPKQVQISCQLLEGPPFFHPHALQLAADEVIEVIQEYDTGVGDRVPVPGVHGNIVRR